MKIGVLADCQYADIPDRHQEGRTQRFKEVPRKLEDALENMSDCEYIIHLGDIIQSQDSEDATSEELRTICSIFESCPAPKIHVLGNHCIGTLPRTTILQTLHIPLPGYYSIDLSALWKCIILDTTEMSGHSGYPEDSFQCEEARAYLKNHPYTDDEPHMISWNGGTTSSQNQWLLQELDEAMHRGKNVILCSHHQVHPLAARQTHLAWNFPEISEIISKYSSIVKLILSGHDHIGGGCRITDGNGNAQFYITVPAVLEAPCGSNSYMIFELDETSGKNGDEGNQACRISARGCGAKAIEIVNSLFMTQT